MANFDTPAKRFSGMGLGVDEAPLLPISSGSFDQGDRQHFLDMYSGILATNPAPSSSIFINRLLLLGVG